LAQLNAPQGKPVTDPDLLAKLDAPKAGPVQGGVEGFLSGISGGLRDEIYGLSEASGLPKALGGFRAPVGAARMLMGTEGAQQSYEKARDEKRAEVKKIEADQPGMFTTGQVGGAVALPLGAARGATLGARAIRGAGVGGAYGALQGFGEGEGGADSAQGAV